MDEGRVPNNELTLKPILFPSYYNIALPLQ